MLKVKIQSTAIVVLSSGNNPRLLNSDFLKRNGVAQEDWAVADTLVTPPVSHVTFENGLQVLVEENRLHFRVNKAEKFPWAGELPRVAIAYMDLLPHVQYGAIGLNFVYTSEEANSQDEENVIIKKLLMPGPWLECASGVSDAVLDLQFHGEFPQMNIRIGKFQNVEQDGKMLNGIIFNVNFHQDFSGSPKEERDSYIKDMDSQQERFFDFLNRLPF